MLIIYNNKLEIYRRYVFYWNKFIFKLKINKNNQHILLNNSLIISFYYYFIIDCVKKKR